MSVALALGLAPSAFAQGANPVSPGLPTPAQPTTTAAPTPTITNAATSSTSSDTGLSGSNALAIAIGALIVLGGISLFIWRDARRRAPARHRAAAATAGADGRTGSKRQVKARKLSPAERKRRKRGRAR